MSLRIALENRPEFYTNLDYVSGKVILTLNRAEQIGNIVVKLEGEAITALQVPHPLEDMSSPRHGPPPGPPGSIVSENHKLLYKLQQVFPDEYYASGSNPYGAHPLQPGDHEFPFKFKLPVNNACSDTMAMSKIGGIGGAGGFASGGGLFGMGGVRVMDGSKQLFLRHVTRTLPPSLTAFPREAEIRYYIKVTVQRPGLLKENWRFQAGLKFQPIEPPRPQQNGQEGFARRPFTFRANASTPSQEKKRSSMFSKKDGDSKDESASLDATGHAAAPSVEVSARLPHPPILTCLKPLPIRLIAKKLNDNPSIVYLVSFQVDLIGYTEIRCHNLFNRKQNRWVVASDTNLSIPLTSPTDEVGKELLIPDDVWKNIALPNTVSPSFATCNIVRRYELEIKLGVAWGKPPTKSGGLFSKESGIQPQTIYLPLHFARVEVFSGITPPAELVEAARSPEPGRATFSTVPKLPPRRTNSNPGPSGQPQPQPVPTYDPLYPPPLAPGQTAPAYDDAPPSYDEAVAENLAGPFDGMQPRPAYSGQTNENAPSQMPTDSKS